MISRTIVYTMKEGRLQLLFGRINDMQEWNTGSLRAPFWRCYCPLDPGGSVCYEGAAIPMHPGKAYLIPPLTEFEGRSESPFTKVFGHFAFDVPNIAFATGIYEFLLPESGHGDLQLLRNGADEALLPELLMLQTITVGLNQLPQSSRQDLTSDIRIQSLVEQMRQNPTSEWGNTDLAGELNMAVPSMIRLFKNCMGITPQKYLKNLRLQRAGTLLAHTDRSLEDIADECGFWDRNHFTRAFKTFFQCPPAAYRRQNHG